ncbi:hypothetical protein MKW92_041244 [Papaver armeniacum]|nr:hypothetical protein MKW92_041244 [Papaver armeniacum]
MADAMVLQVLVSPLLGTVFDNISSLIKSQFALVWGVKGELKKLFSVVSTIRDVIEDAEIKQITDKPIRNWLLKLKIAVYDADDILDDFTSQVLKISRSETTGPNNSSTNNQVLSHSASFTFKLFLSCRKLVEKIKKLREVFHEIAEERSKFHLNLNLHMGDGESKARQTRQTSSSPVELQVYGRDTDKEHLVNFLIGEASSQGLQGNGGLSTCAILGMGGLGKTTLAQMVHNDERISSHFEVRCWVYASENFEQEILLKAIFESIGGNVNDVNYLDTLQHRLQQKLSGKRFLVVLDDVWNEDQAKWDKFVSSLRCGGRGSSILVTTRLETVARITAVEHVWRLGNLSDEDCWSLFKHRAFLGNEHVPSNLEAIGKEIVKKCLGVPLAAKFLGGLLCFKRDEHEWVLLRDSEIWDLPQNTEDAILPALRLSYNHLSPLLKQCFAYFSIFAKSCIMAKDEVIQLWIANGFIQSKGGSMELEDVGHGIFNDLIWRSFFQEFDKEADGNIVSFKMHDLACSIMEDECAVVKVTVRIRASNSKPISNDADIVGRRSNNVRHLSFIFGHSSSSSSFSTSLESSIPDNPRQIRTLLLLHRQFVTQHSHIYFIFSTLKWLRVLDLSLSDIDSVPNSIANLKQLRYLNLSCTNITSLPNESFCSLSNLRTVKLNECAKLQKLPQDMVNMRSLRHIHMRRSAISGMPRWMRKLHSLQTLSIFIVGLESGRGIEELQGLGHLRGKLVIKGMEVVKTPTDARNANLMRKKNLSSLSFIWSQSPHIRAISTCSTKDKEVLEAIGDGEQCYTNLKRLRIKDYGGTEFPSWMKVSCLPNLVKITLISCSRCQHLPSLGKLPFLRILRIRRMPSVKCFGFEFYSDGRHGQDSFFRSLEEFEISELSNIIEWSPPPSSSSSSSLSSSSTSPPPLQLPFPCLKRLDIICCGKLRRCPPLPLCLQHLQVRKCHDTLFTGSLSLPPHISTLSFCFNLSTLPREPMENLISLVSLEIKDCDELIHLSDGMRYLASLERLVITNCPKLKLLSDDFHHLTALRALHLMNLPKMTTLPIPDSHHLRQTLQSLEIHDCLGLTTLPAWMFKFTSLQNLKFSNCENLKLSPEAALQLKNANKTRPLGSYPTYFPTNAFRASDRIRRAFLARRQGMEDQGSITDEYI